MQSVHARIAGRATQTSCRGVADAGKASLQLFGSANQLAIVACPAGAWPRPALAHAQPARDDDNLLLCCIVSLNACLMPRSVGHAGLLQLMLGAQFDASAVWRTLRSVAVMSSPTLMP